MNGLRAFSIRTIQGLAVVSALLLAYASTGDAASEFEPLIEDDRAMDAAELAPADQLRVLCRLDWPIAAGSAADQARRRACRNVDGWPPHVRPGNQAATIRSLPASVPRKFVPGAG